MTTLKQAVVGIAALICALASLVVLAAPAPAAKPSKGKATELTIGFTGTNFRGRVKSANVCEPSRKILLFEVDSEGFVSVVDKTSSLNAGGKYAFDDSWPMQGSEYYTKATKSKAGGVTCKVGRSPRFSFGIDR